MQLPRASITLALSSLLFFSSSVNLCSHCNQVRFIRLRQRFFTDTLISGLFSSTGCEKFILNYSEKYMTTYDYTKIFMIATLSFTNNNAAGDLMSYRRALSLVQLYKASLPFCITIFVLIHISWPCQPFWPCL